MNSPSEQLPLAVQLRDDATFSNFYAGDNGLCLAALQGQLTGGDGYIYIHGSRDSGRSHLLQAACHKAETLQLAAVYLPLKELQDYSANDLLEGLETMSLVCLDDIDAVIADADWQQSLFHFFNRLRDNGAALLIAGSSNVGALNIALADLASRLSWGTVFHLHQLSDEQRIAAIKMRAMHRGLELSDDVAQYIYNRTQRDTDSLIEVLNKLDAASLQQQRKLTTPFVKSALGW